MAYEPTEPDLEFRGDCGRCVGLCCVALAFDHSRWFGLDKAADVPCRHLRSTNRCAIHRSLSERGFAGCAQYDCYGAGQHVTRKYLAGRDWRTQPQLAPVVFSAFRASRHVHELLFLLREAARLGLSGECAARRRQLIGRLQHAMDIDLEACATFDASPYQHDTHEFLRGLRENARATRRRCRRLPVFNQTFAATPVSGLPAHRDAIGAKAWRRNEEQQRRNRPP
jgi:hypothetical protein